jgi:hypothetical protein
VPQPDNGTSEQRRRSDAVPGTWTLCAKKVFSFAKRQAAGNFPAAVENRYRLKLRLEDRHDFVCPWVDDDDLVAN